MAPTLIIPHKRGPCWRGSLEIFNLDWKFQSEIGRLKFSNPGAILNFFNLWALWVGDPKNLLGDFWPTNQGSLNGGVSNGGVSRSGLVLPFFCPFWRTFPIFLGFSRFARGWSGDFPDSSFFFFSSFLGLLRAPMRNSPERVRDTIWTFPEKSGKHPSLETPRFSFSQTKVILIFEVFWNNLR